MHVVVLLCSNFWLVKDKTFNMKHSDKITLGLFILFSFYVCHCECLKFVRKYIEHRIHKRDHQKVSSGCGLSNASRIAKCPPEMKEKCQHSCEMVNGKPTCKCYPGFIAKHDTCIDVDECQQSNGGCKVICINTLGSFRCDCNNGFRLAADGKSCEDINECLLRNGHGPCQDVCQNTPGSYLCECTRKGTKLADDKHSCSETNQCELTTAGCTHGCISFHGTTRCTCPDGMELDSDWKTCLDIDECQNETVCQFPQDNCVNTIGSYYCTNPHDITAVQLGNVNDSKEDMERSNSEPNGDEEWNYWKEYEDQNEYDNNENDKLNTNFNNNNNNNKNENENDNYDEYSEKEQNHKTTNNLSTAKIKESHFVPTLKPVTSLHSRDNKDNRRADEYEPNKKHGRTAESEDFKNNESPTTINPTVFAGKSGNFGAEILQDGRDTPTNVDEIKITTDLQNEDYREIEESPNIMKSIRTTMKMKDEEVDNQHFTEITSQTKTEDYKYIENPTTANPILFVESKVNARYGINEEDISKSTANILTTKNVETATVLESILEATTDEQAIIPDLIQDTRTRTQFESNNLKNNEYYENPTSVEVAEEKLDGRSGIFDPDNSISSSNTPTTTDNIKHTVNKFTTEVRNGDYGKNGESSTYLLQPIPSAANIIDNQNRNGELIDFLRTTTIETDECEEEETPKAVVFTEGNINERAGIYDPEISESNYATTNIVDNISNSVNKITDEIDDGYYGEEKESPNILKPITSTASIIDIKSRNEKLLPKKTEIELDECGIEKSTTRKPAVFAEGNLNRSAIVYDQDISRSSYTTPNHVDNIAYNINKISTEIIDEDYVKNEETSRFPNTMQTATEHARNLDLIEIPANSETETNKFEDIKEIVDQTSPVDAGKMNFNVKSGNFNTDTPISSYTTSPTPANVKYTVNKITSEIRNEDNEKNEEPSTFLQPIPTTSNIIDEQRYNGEKHGDLPTKAEIATEECANEANEESTTLKPVDVAAMNFNVKSGNFDTDTPISSYTASTTPANIKYTVNKSTSELRNEDNEKNEEPSTFLQPIPTTSNIIDEQRYNGEKHGDLPTKAEIATEECANEADEESTTLKPVDVAAMNFNVKSGNFDTDTPISSYTASTTPANIKYTVNKSTSELRNEDNEKNEEPSTFLQPIPTTSNIIDEQRYNGEKHGDLPTKAEIATEECANEADEESTTLKPVDVAAMNFNVKSGNFDTDTPISSYTASTTPANIKYTVNKITSEIRNGDNERNGEPSTHLQPIPTTGKTTVLDEQRYNEEKHGDLPRKTEIETDECANEEDKASTTLKPAVVAEMNFNERYDVFDADISISNYTTQIIRDNLKQNFNKITTEMGNRNFMIKEETSKIPNLIEATTETINTNEHFRNLDLIEMSTKTETDNYDVAKSSENETRTTPVDVHEIKPDIKDIDISRSPDNVPTTTDNMKYIVNKITTEIQSRDIREYEGFPNHLQPIPTTADIIDEQSYNGKLIELPRNSETESDEWVNDQDQKSTTQKLAVFDADNINGRNGIYEPDILRSTYNTPNTIDNIEYNVYKITTEIQKLVYEENEEPRNIMKSVKPTTEIEDEYVDNQHLTKFTTQTQTESEKAEDYKYIENPTPQQPVIVAKDNKNERNGIFDPDNSISSYNRLPTTDNIIHSVNQITTEVQSANYIKNEETSTIFVPIQTTEDILHGRRRNEELSDRLTKIEMETDDCVDEEDEKATTLGPAVVAQDTLNGRDGIYDLEAPSIRDNVNEMTSAIQNADYEDNAETSKIFKAFKSTTKITDQYVRKQNAVEMPTSTYSETNEDEHYENPTNLKPPVIAEGIENVKFNNRNQDTPRSQDTTPSYDIKDINTIFKTSKENLTILEPLESITENIDDEYEEYENPTTLRPVVTAEDKENVRFNNRNQDITRSQDTTPSYGIKNTNTISKTSKETVTTLEPVGTITGPMDEEYENTATLRPVVTAENEENVRFNNRNQHTSRSQDTTPFYDIKDTNTISKTSKETLTILEPLQSITENIDDEYEEYENPTTLKLVVSTEDKENVRFNNRNQDITRPQDITPFYDIKYNNNNIPKTSKETVTILEPAGTISVNKDEGYEEYENPTTLRPVVTTENEENVRFNNRNQHTSRSQDTTPSYDMKNTNTISKTTKETVTILEPVVTITGNMDEEYEEYENPTTLRPVVTAENGENVRFNNRNQDITPSSHIKNTKTVCKISKETSTILEPVGTITGNMDEEYEEYENPTTLRPVVTAENEENVRFNNRNQHTSRSQDTTPSSDIKNTNAISKTSKETVTILEPLESITENIDDEYEEYENPTTLRSVVTAEDKENVRFNNRNQAITRSQDTTPSYGIKNTNTISKTSKETVTILEPFGTISGTINEEYENPTTVRPVVTAENEENVRFNNRNQHTSRSQDTTPSYDINDANTISKTSKETLTILEPLQSITENIDTEYEEYENPTTLRPVVSAEDKENVRFNNRNQDITRPQDITPFSHIKNTKTVCKISKETSTILEPVGTITGNIDEEYEEYENPTTLRAVVTDEDKENVRFNNRNQDITRSQDTTPSYDIKNTNTISKISKETVTILEPVGTITGTMDEEYENPATLRPVVTAENEENVRFNNRNQHTSRSQVTTPFYDIKDTNTISKTSKETVTILEPVGTITGNMDEGYEEYENPTTLRPVVTAENEENVIFNNRNQHTSRSQDTTPSYDMKNTNTISKTTKETVTILEPIGTITGNMDEEYEEYENPTTLRPVVTAENEENVRFNNRNQDITRSQDITPSNHIKNTKTVCKISKKTSTILEPVGTITGNMDEEYLNPSTLRPVFTAEDQENVRFKNRNQDIARSQDTTPSYDIKYNNNNIPKTSKETVTILEPAGTISVNMDEGYEEYEENEENVRFNNRNQHTSRSQDTTPSYDMKNTNTISKTTKETVTILEPVGTITGNMDEEYEEYENPTTLRPVVTAENGENVRFNNRNQDITRPQDITPSSHIKNTKTVCKISKKTTTILEPVGTITGNMDEEYLNPTTLRPVFIAEDKENVRFKNRNQDLARSQDTTPSYDIKYNNNIPKTSKETVTILEPAGTISENMDEGYEEYENPTTLRPVVTTENEENVRFNNRNQYTSRSQDTTPSYDMKNTNTVSKTSKETLTTLEPVGTITENIDEEYENPTTLRRVITAEDIENVRFNNRTQHTSRSQDTTPSYDMKNTNTVSKTSKECSTILEPFGTIAKNKSSLCKVKIPKTQIRSGEDGNLKEHENFSSPKPDVNTRIPNKNDASDKYPCKPGFTLSPNGLCVDLDECAEGIGRCSHDCVNLHGSYYCTCPKGYRIYSTDPYTCQDINECLSNPCSHTCINEIGSYRCECPSNFALVSKFQCAPLCSYNQEAINGVKQCDCPPRFKPSEDQRTCEFIDGPYKCTNGSFKCDCVKGYRLASDGVTCVDENECDNRDHGCSQICVNREGTYECLCNVGYELSLDGKTCHDIDECKSKSLNNCDQNCHNTNGSYICSCNPGYSLVNQKFCKDIDECAYMNGHCSQICSNSIGSYECKCEIGVLGEDNRTCKTQHVSCEWQNGGCSHKCSLGFNGKIGCSCPEDHVLDSHGKTCIKKSLCVATNKGRCTKIDLCQHENGGCSHYCENVKGKPRCSCPPNYDLVNNKICKLSEIPCPESLKSHPDVKCEEVNRLLNGSCPAHCIETKQQHSCICRKSFELKSALRQFNPCGVRNGGCSHSCTNVNGVAICSCPADYRLVDRKNCHMVLRISGIPCPESLKVSQGVGCEEISIMPNSNCPIYCIENEQQNSCICPNRHELRRTNSNLNPCAVRNGGCSHFCANSNGIATCSCPENHKLVDNKFCESSEIPCPESLNLAEGVKCEEMKRLPNGRCPAYCAENEQQNSCTCPSQHQANSCAVRNGGCSHTCEMVNGQATCKCPSNLQLTGKGCSRSTCEDNNSGCSHYCTMIRGQPKCSCPANYKLGYNGQTCVPQVCHVDNGGCSHICKMEGDTRRCSCPEGHMLRPNHRVCKKINYCHLNRAGCSHGCRSLLNSYECTCPMGFHLDSNDRHTCVDTNECLINNGNCQKYCKNYLGYYKCGCDEGYILDDDGHHCILANLTSCHMPNSPRFGKLFCDQNDDGRVSTGGKCYVQCNAGYRLVGHSTSTCNSKGEWSSSFAAFCVGEEAVCKQLNPIANGWLTPRDCARRPMYPGEICRVTCRKGYTLKSKKQFLVCDTLLNWDPAPNDDLCVRDDRESFIVCPNGGKLNFILPPNQGHMRVTIPRPITNVQWNELVESTPAWGMNLTTILPAGRTEVLFTAKSSSSSSSNATLANCQLVIDVLDQQNPTVSGCPNNMEYSMQESQYCMVVNWTEPEFKDNVGVVTIYKSKTSGKAFRAGLHHVYYIASDEAGNRAFCHFTVNIKTTPNQVLPNPNVKSKRELICRDDKARSEYNGTAPNGNSNCYWKYIENEPPNQQQIGQQQVLQRRMHSERKMPPESRNQWQIGQQQQEVRRPQQVLQRKVHSEGKIPPGSTNQRQSWQQQQHLRRFQQVPPGRVHSESNIPPESRNQGQIGQQQVSPRRMHSERKMPPESRNQWQIGQQPQEVRRPQQVLPRRVHSEGKIPPESPNQRQIWQHQQQQHLRRFQQVPPGRVHSESKMPPELQRVKRKYFDWYDRCC